MLKKVVFLDRDGVINRDSPDYIKSWSEFEFLPGSIAAIQGLTASGFSPLIITNQSAVGRQMISIRDLEHIHFMMKSAVSSGGGEIKDIFFCPHRPDEGCDCRKPKPGMLYQARERFDVDISTAVMVGDSAKDIECARNAGCGHAILVRTGNGIQAETALAEKKIFPDRIVRDLHEAARWIIDHLQ